MNCSYSAAHSLLTKLVDPVCKPKAGEDVHPEQRSHCNQLVERCPEEKVEQVHIASVLETLFLNDIH